MKNSIKLLIGGCLLLLASTISYLTFFNENSDGSIAEKRKKHQEFLTESPFKESLTWDKKERKLKGLPPNRYFEQMYELTMNPATGLMEDGKLSELRSQLIKQRASERNPGDASNSWDERGPNDIGGRTRVMLFDPNDASANIVFAGGVSGGLWKNTNITNSNSQWSRVQNVPGNLAVTSITVDPRNSNRWYVGTGEQYTAGDVVGNGVYVTNDGGNSWNALTIPASGPDSFDFNASNLFLKGIYYVNDVLAWDNGTNTELFVGVGSAVYGDSGNPRNWLGLQSAGIYRSTDGGSNWSRIESSNLSYDFQGSTYYYTPNDFEVGADNKIWLGTIGSVLGDGGGRVFSSTNGATWTEAAASPLTDSNRVELAVSSSNANKLYALTQGNSEPVHVYGTTNGFASITTKALPNDADNGIPANDFTRGQSFYDLMIEVDPTNDNILYVGGIDLFRSTNGASGWTQISKWSNNPGLNTLNTPFVHADQHAMTFRPGNANQAVFGNDGGIFYASSLTAASGSSSAISVRNNNYNVTQYVKAGIGPNGTGDTTGIFTAGAQDNGSQAFRNGNTAPGINGSEELSDGDGFYTFVDKDGQYMIATFIQNVIYRFNLPWNGQGRRQGGATTLSSDQNTGDFVNPMDYDSNANRLLTNGSSGTNFAIKSFNVAANSNGTLTNAALTAKPTAFRASPFANNTWYAGLENGGLIRLTGVTNSAATFTTIATPFVGSVSSVRFGETANDIFVTIHNYSVASVWATSNGGSSWSSKEGNLPNIPVRDFLQNPLSRGEAIIATQLGVWATSNFGDTNPTWSQSYNGMSDVSVTSLDYWDVSGDNTNNKIIASTYGRGVFTGSFTANADSQAPSAPTALTTSNISENSIDLSWNASTDNVGIAGYDVYRDGVLQTTVTSTSYSATGLSANTAYSFYVIAKDAAGNASSQSSSVNATTLAPDTTAPTAPSSLTASGTTDTATTLSWTASTDNVAVASYDILRGTTVIGNTTNTTFNVTGLAQNTAYSFSVKAKDLAGNISDVSNIVNVSTDATPVNYCASQSTNVNDEFISRVQLNTIDNTSTGQFYSDFTSISTTLTKGNQYTISVTPTWTGTLYNEGYGVWIDYNKNGSFDDAGELVFSAAPSQTTPASGSFTVPTGALTTSTRMRVTLSYNAIPTSCLSFQYGEVEDYTINIANAVADTTAPVITLNGSSTINLNVGDTYNELGATATDNTDGNLTSSIVTSGNVNTSNVGSYIVNYNVSDAAGNAATQISRTVNVSDGTAPVITLNGATTINLNVGDFYNELGATASDNVDGDLTSSISTTGNVNTNTAGNYIVNYNVSDAAGNAATQVSRTVNVFADTTAPVITLNGATTIDLNIGDAYNELGATAIDNIDGNLTSSIVISGNVNTNVVGNYIVNYNVSDTAGNTATEVSRNVNITAVTSSGCISGISTFPYSESFEGNLGAWSQSSEDDIDWTVNSNGTPSNNTGPSSAFNGNSYIFVEASGNGSGYPNKQAIVTSPCFNLSNETTANFSFNYHMFGASDMGTIALEASSDNGDTWTSIWNESGNKGNQWITTNISLSAYTGGSVQLRFNRVTGSTWQADIAIDNIQLTNGGAVSNSCTAEVTSFPYNEGFEGSVGDWSQASGDDLNWTVNSNSTPSNNTGPSSAFQGSSYIFVEASGNGTGFPSKGAILISPCFDLGNVSVASFNFNYHMFGATDMGTIDVEASNDNGSSWSSIWTESGNKGNQWLTASIDLSDYLGDTVQLRFNRVTGSTWQADIAIDNISLTNTQASSNTNFADDSLFNLSDGSFKLYPNPTKNVLNVQLTTTVENSFRIINSIGQVVKTGKLKTNSIEVSQLKTGVYLLEINDGEERLIKKFFKQ
jgi:chitodextrinase